MKDILKYAGLLLLGLFVAVIGYPLLHETGHWITAILFGAEVTDFKLFPLPYVICKTPIDNKASLVFTGLSGLYLPAVLSLIIRPKSFWLWYGNLIVNGICLLSFIISLAAVILYSFGITVANEDVIQILMLRGKGSIALAISAISAIAVMSYSIIKQKPINRIINYFEIPINKASAE